jgi:uncharacterized iron-regulated protein
MWRIARCVAALGLSLLLPAGARAQVAECERPGGAALRDVHWRYVPPPHPLVGQVLKGDRAIPIAPDACTRTPLQQLIAELWQTLRGGGMVLLGEVHDNPEHHAVREDILWPRLDRIAPTAELRPAAVFEHIRTDQQAAVAGFYDKAARSRRLWRANDLLRELDWAGSGWPAAKMFYPLFDGALWAHLPIVPGNAPRERTRALAKSGKSALPADEQAKLEAAETMPAPLLDALLVELEASHCGVMPASAFANMSLAQRYTDAVLAEALLGGAKTQGAAFLLAGNGHVRTDRGVPWHLRRMAPDRKVAAVMLLEVEEGKTDPQGYVPRDPEGRPVADYVLFTPRQARPDPCQRLREGRK